uniref:Multimerin 2 n=1 Tax=Salvator merianae TaxID=96440 RepID=A0A8D0BJA7_SALMN
MLAEIVVLCATLGLLQSDVHSRYPEYHVHKPKTQEHRIQAKAQPSPLPEEYWGRELVKEEAFNPVSTAVTDDVTDIDDTGNHQPRNENWCSSIRPQLSTYVAVCKTEKYVIKSQQRCPNGTPDCQKIMYRAALKPVYQVKQRVLYLLHWKCCPGYFGKNCEHHEPNFLPLSTNQPEDWEGERETFTNQRDIIEAHQSHEALLEDLQNDIHQATNNLGVLQKMLHDNNSSTRGEVNHNQSEAQRQLFQEMLLPHVESFLLEHFNPVWVNFNKSLQDLSTILKNLSRDVEVNRKSIERFQESTVPKKEFQELGTKFESKVQANMLRVDQMKRETESHLHLHQAAIYYNLTMLKADADLKFKRHHKIQHSYFSALNNSIVDMRQEQNKFQDKLESLSRNLEIVSAQFGRQREAFSNIDIQFFNRTLADHTQELKKLFDEFDEDYEELRKSIEDVKTNSKYEIVELREDLLEKRRILEEYRDDLERKILTLNNSLANIQEDQWDLQQSMKACRCETLPSGTDLENQANMTQINTEEIKQLETHLKDLAAAFPLIYQSLDFQQEQSRKLEAGISSLKAHTEKLSENIGSLKKNDQKMDGHIKHLNSSFNSLLVDALRHESALEALLGREIMEDLPEKDIDTPVSTREQVSIKLISDNLKEQNITLDSLMKRIYHLEMVDHHSGPSENKSYTPSVLKQQIEGSMQEVGATQHSGVEHLEPNHEASMEDVLDNPAYHDIMILKKEIRHLSWEMKQHELQWGRASVCCNDTIVNVVEPLSISMESLREDLAATQETLEEHLHIFQKLFGSSKELAAANVSLDVTKIQSVMSRRMRKQLRDKKESHNHREGTLNGRNKIHTETVETGTPVAFYVRYPEGRTVALGLNETSLNYGEGFFPEHGYFKTPHSGVYMIAISMEHMPGPALGKLLFTNKQSMTLFSNKKRKTNGGPMTTFALVELKKGESMRFQLVQGAIIKENPAGLSMAGFLIFKT